MALREGTTLGILTGQTHRMAFHQQRTECQRFTGCPVDTLAGIDHLSLGFKLAHDFGIKAEVVRHGSQRFADFTEAVLGNARDATTVIARCDRHTGPHAVQPICFVGFISRRRFERLFQVILETAQLVVQLALREHAFMNQFLRIDFASPRVSTDFFVHQRLRKHRLVTFVMAMPAITNHVDDSVFLEALTIFDGNPCDVHDGFHIVCVNMENRRRNHLGHVRAVRRRARMLRVRGKADLVVDHDMNGTAGLIAAQVRKIECFRHKALAGKCRIPMQQQPHDFFTFTIVFLALLGAHFAQADRVDAFQVRWVGGQRQVHRAAVKHAVRGRAQVVLHIAGPTDVFRARRASLEFMEDRLKRLRHHVGEHVQAPTVCHAEHDFFDPQLRAPLKNLLHRRHQAFATIKAEALGAGKFLIEKFLEPFGFNQPV